MPYERKVFDDKFSMKEIYFTPGPSSPYFTLKDHLKQALNEDLLNLSPDGRRFREVYNSTAKILREIAGVSEEYHVLFLPSVNEIREICLQSLVDKQSYHRINGHISEQFYELSGQKGRRSSKETSVVGSSTSFEEADLLVFTQNDHTNGAALPVEEIYDANSKNDDALTVVDACSSFPVVDIDFDKIDSLFFSAHHCFGLPVGLGVWFVNDRCVEKSKRLYGNRNAFAGWRKLHRLVEDTHHGQIDDGPNPMFVWLLGRVAENFMEKGLDVIRRETAYKAAVLYNGLEAHPGIVPNVEDKNYRSKIVVAARCGDSNLFVEGLSKYGLIVGKGHGQNKNCHLRIGNYPTHSKEHIEMLSDKLLQIG